MSTASSSPDLAVPRTDERCLSVRGIGKTFVGQVALRDFDLTINAGEIHALLGENGSGKSTFIKILTGYHRPDAGGVITVAGHDLHFGSPESSYNLGCRVVHQDLGLVESASVADNLSFNTGFARRFGTIRTRAEQRRAADDLERVGLTIDPNTLVADLSPTARTGVAVARALRPNPAAPTRLLVLDEPTASLPQTEVDQLLAIVEAAARGGTGVLYVTHRLDEVFRLAHNVTVLRDGRKVVTRPTAGLDHHGLVSLLVGEEFDTVATQLAASRAVTDRTALRVAGLSFGHLTGFDLAVAPGEVVGISGITGSGREFLLGAVFGAVARRAGTVSVDDRPIPPGRPDLSVPAGLAYLPPDRKSAGGVFDLSARENISLARLDAFWRWPVLRRGAERAESRRWFDDLDIRPRGAVDRKLSAFSGGNQQKILLAKWLRCQPKVLLLDEPTQGVDVPAKAAIHGRILQSAADGMAVVVSSADVDELTALCHRVVVLADGRIVSDVSGAAKSVANISRHMLTSRSGETP
jgi:ribose transport system ATP-binding protein